MSKFSFASVGGLLAAWSCLPIAGLAAESGQYQYTTFYVPNSSAVQVVGLNDDGAIVGSYETIFGSGAGECFLYTSGTLTTLSPPGGTDGTTQVTGIDDAGAVYGDFEVIGSRRVDAFVFKDGRYSTFGHDGERTSFSFVGRHGLALGTVVPLQEVGISPGTAFDYRNGSIRHTKPLPRFAIVLATNDRGVAVGAEAPPAKGQYEGFSTSRGVYQVLPGPPGGQVIPYGINDLGVIVGEVADQDSDSEAYLLKDSKMRTYSYPNSFQTFFIGIDNAGVIAGGTDQGAFVLRNGVVETISPPGSSATFISRINEKGQLAGSFYGPLGHGSSSVFLATPG